MTQEEDVELVKNVGEDFYQQHLAVDGSLHEGLAHPCEQCDALEALRPLAKTYQGILIREDPSIPQGAGPIPAEFAMGYNAVEPPHYQRGPIVVRDIGEQITKGQSKFRFIITCIEVMRHVKDPRLATALKYIWRVAFGGKREPDETRSDREIDERDINSAIWYLQDWVDNPT